MDNCKLKECIRPQRSAGFCQAHYLQMYNHGRITKHFIGEKEIRGEYKKRPKKQCLKCDKHAASLGLCMLHYLADYRKKGIS